MTQCSDFFVNAILFSFLNEYKIKNGCMIIACFFFFTTTNGKSGFFVKDKVTVITYEYIPRYIQIQNILVNILYVWKLSMFFNSSNQYFL